MGERISHFSSEFLKLCRVVELLKETGASEEVLMSLLEEKLCCDLAHDESKLRIPEPSRN